MTGHDINIILDLIQLLNSFSDTNVIFLWIHCNETLIIG